MDNTVAFSNLKIGGLPTLGAEIGPKAQKTHFSHKKMSKSVKFCQSGGLVMEFLSFGAQLVRNRPHH